MAAISLVDLARRLLRRMLVLRYFAVLAFTIAVSACATTQATTPRSRVAQDLGCTTQGTSVREIGPIPGEKSARWQVSGCGRTAVYVCTTPVRDCWREGGIKPDAEPVTEPPRNP